VYALDNTTEDESHRILKRRSDFRRILAFTLLLILLGIFTSTPRVEAQVCNFINVRTQYPTLVHTRESFQILVEFTAECDYSGQITLRVNLVDERTSQVLSTASWTLFQNYGSEGTSVSPWLQLEVSAPNTTGYWPLMLYTYNVDGEGSSSQIPFRIQVL